MGEIEFVLSKTLKELDITPNYLAVESKVRPNTVYSMTSGEAKSLRVDILEKILITLNEIAETKGIQRVITTDDVVTFSRNRRKK
jgi:predicted transcriptional regulator